METPSAAPVSSAAPVVSSAASAASSAAYAASSAVSSVKSALSSALASVTGNGTTPVRPTSTVSQFTGGAPQATKAAALVGAAALAILAL